GWLRGCMVGYCSSPATQGIVSPHSNVRWRYRVVRGPASSSCERRRILLNCFWARVILSTRVPFWRLSWRVSASIGRAETVGAHGDFWIVWPIDFRAQRPGLPSLTVASHDEDFAIGCSSA